LDFSISQGSGPVSLSVALEDERVSADAIEIGANGSRPEERPFLIPADPHDRLPVERFVERHLTKPVGRSLRVVAVKLRAPLHEEAAVSGSNLPADVRRQLEELGYLELE
jgi:hypothetical protein